MMEGFSTQLIVDADRTAQGWEVVVRFDAEDMQAAWSDLSDAQLRAHATILGEEIVERSSRTKRERRLSMKFKITETCDYEVEAQSDAEAEELFLDFGPSFDERFNEGPISFVGVTEREVVAQDA